MIKQCLACGKDMKPDGPAAIGFVQLGCEEGHDYLGFLSIGEQYFTASETLANRLKEAGHNVERSSEGHWNIVQGDSIKPVFLNKKSDEKGCFLATACYGNYDSVEVVVLRRFRDEILMSQRSGRAFVRIYYKVSPRLAKCIYKSKILRATVKLGFISPIVEIIRRLRKDNFKGNDC